MKPRALVLDDEPLMREFVAETLREAGFDTLAHEDPLRALTEWEGFGPDVAFLDLRLPGKSGVEVMREAHARGYSGACVMLTAFGTVDTAVAALREGAEDYLMKPCSADRIEQTARRALQVARLALENRKLRGMVRDAAPRELIGHSPALRALLEQIPTLARSRATVLVLGESGTGKELLARALHEQGPRAEGPWVSVNCAALPESLLESELFGHERGAFTGAGQRHLGRFEQADGGTLLLDEISEISPPLQAKLLRVLQEREFYRLGGNESVRVDVRVVATSNRDLSDMVRRGQFREDLFYRLNVVPLTLPPLRERDGDVPLLAHHALARACAETGARLEGFSPEALAALEAHPWPGNVRELMNSVERGAVFARGTRIELQDLRLDRPVGAMRSVLSLDELERQAIVGALEVTSGNRLRAAQILKISVRTLRNKLRQYREEGVQNLPPDAAEFAAPQPHSPRPILRQAA